jgi:hypothetical protein
MNPMTERRTRAERENFRKNTGPKTAEGKVRSSQNAAKHRLASPIWSSSRDRISELIEALAGRDASAERREAAREVAEAQAQLERVREVNEATIARHRLPGYEPTDRHWPSEAGETSMEYLKRLLPELKPLRRYETRALSRRKRAMCKFRRSKQ